MHTEQIARSAIRWPALLLSVALLSACGGGGGGAPAAGGGNPPPAGGGGGGTLPTGFAVFTSNRTQFLVNEPWIASFDGSDYRSLAAGLPAGGNTRTLAARLSPDGHKLAVVTDSGTEHAYAIIDVATGAPITLPFTNPRDSNIGHNFSWSPDSSRVTLNRQGSGTNPNYTPKRTYVMNADGSNLFEPVASATDEIFASSWSPAGTHFAVLSNPLNEIGGMPNPDEDENLFMVSADGSSAINIAPGIGLEQNVIRQYWSGDGSKFTFEINYRASASATEDSKQILVHDLSTGVTASVVSPGTTFTVLNSISSDGSWLTYRQNTTPAGTHEQLYVVSSSGGAGAPVGPGAVGTSSGVGDVKWAPIGDKLAYVHNSQPGSPTSRVLYLADSTGSAVALHAASENAAGFVWSPDGRYIAFSTTDPSAFPNGAIYVFDTTSTNNAVRLTIEPEFSRGGGALIWSPDSQWLYAQQFDDVQQAAAVRAYPAGNWTSARTLGTGSVGTPANFSAAAEEWGNIVIYPTPDSSAIVWRRRDTMTNITDVMVSDPTDPSLTRAISQAPASSGPFVNVEQLFAR